MIIHSISELIGNTPMLDLAPMVPMGGARLLAKMEMFNPGGSIKDRPAMAMVQAAENAGSLRRGMTIVEPTAGNTGIGLALVGNLKGYKTVFYVPDKMSIEKISLMRLYGAEVHLVPRQLGMPECIRRARAYAETRGNCFVPQQFANPANPGQAENILGPEIYEQLGFYPDGLAIGAGTGGTFTGLARWLKRNNPNGQCWLVQPEGSVFKGGPKGDYQVEGIGNSFIPETLDLSIADKIVDIPDQTSFERCKELGQKMGILVAGSSGANLEACIQLCMELGEDKTVITVFPDNIERYASKDWVKQIAEGAL